MRTRRATAAALLLIAAGCARCGSSGAAPPERFLPGNASLAVVVPALRDLQVQLAPLIRAVASVPAAASVAELVPAVRDQLGFDPLDPGGLENAGIDPSRGAGLALTSGGEAILALPVGDTGRFEALVARLARDRLGAVRRDSVTTEGRSVTVYRTAEGAPPALSLVVTQKVALLSPGSDGPARVAAAAGRSVPESLAGSGGFGRARSGMPKDTAAILFMPAGSAATMGSALTRDGAAIGISASETRLALRGVLLLSPDRREFWRAALAHGEPPPADPPSRFPADSFLVARYQGDPATVARRVLPLAAAREALHGTGLDLDRDVLELLAPGAAAAVALAPTFEVAAVSRGSDLAANDPFRLVLLSATFRLKDAARAAAVLDRIALLRPEARARVRVERAAPRRWRVGFGGAVLDLAIEGDQLLVGGGRRSLDALLAPPQNGYGAPTETSRAALSSGAAGLVLDFGRLVASFRALPASAYGTGPDAFVMRSLADRLIDPASRLSAASAHLELASDAAVVDVAIDAKQEEPKP